ncbi:P-loop containing nucleoside triphosphate hydrolase protein [Lophium mytilinum]|uniref:RNA helicase n=1 Tax=Lophium mytilinum TaxID=390894 RepID=A0A6A6QV20_9PEZI|nr:P-loop containing nucleoside triphosphate hydrolase protein [Lophium mytilinum]
MANRGAQADPMLRYNDGRRDGRRYDREDSYRPRRERSRSPVRGDRRRDRDREDPRDRDNGRYRRDRDRGWGDRDRDRDYRSRNDDVRDRDRRRPSFDSDRHYGRDSRERGKESSQTPGPTKLSDEERKKQERIEKLAAWKAKKAEEEKAGKDKASSETATPPPKVASPKVASPEVASSKVASPKVPEVAPSHTGKSKPKPKDKSAHKTSSRATLDGGLGKHFPAPPVNPAKNIAEKTSTSASAPDQPLKNGGNVSSFGLKSKAQPAADKIEPKKSLFDDEEVTLKRTFEKLPDFNPDEEPLIGDDDDDVDMSDAGSDNEEAAAARLAAVEKRREEAQTNGDIDMKEAPEEPATNGNNDDDEEEDPLDAFMKGLVDDEPELKPSEKQAVAMYADDDEVTQEATEGIADEFPTVSNKKKKKEIPAVDHSKIAYEPFRKSFYTEPQELQDMTEEELLDLRHELDGIKVRGLDVPKPVVTWPQMSLSMSTLNVLRNLGYDKPTPIQSQAIPTIEAGRDVISVAKTGSGKTLAFGIPVLRHILDQRELGSADGPIALIMAPTRELAVQIQRELKPFLKAHQLKAACCYGGVPIKDNIADVKRGGNHLMVATPGRLIDLMASNSGRVLNLKRVTYVVLDEADRMFDMGFEPQVMKVLQSVRPDRQTVLFSATFPQKMESLAKKALVKPIEILVGGRSTVAAEITQIVKVMAPEKKFHEVLFQLGELFEQDQDARALIFVESQKTAEDLFNKVSKKGYPCVTLHGGKDQIDREDAISDFKAGIIPVVIATSVAARGLDVKQLKLVINYDPPNHLEDYVHRVGRTGRAGNTGTAVTIVTESQERESIHISKALRQSKQPVPEELQKMVVSFLEKVKAGTEKFGGSGFGGKGLEKLNLERERERLRERKTFGGEDGDEEPEKEKEAEADDFTVQTATPSKAPDVQDSGVQDSNLPDLDGEIIVHKTQKPSGGASKGGDSMARVLQAAQAIGGRLTKKNMIHPGQPIDNKGPDAGAYHTTLEINDFPQKARWAVTNRTNVAKILDRTGTSITTKGNFYPPGKTPQEGEMPKLYILVEGDTEAVVKGAMRELQNLLKEGTQASLENDSRAPTGGRYQVL